MKREKNDDRQRERKKKEFVVVKKFKKKVGNEIQAYKHWQWQKRKNEEKRINS